VVLRAWADGDSLFIEVEDDGGSPPELARPGLEPEVPDIGREHGRGLFLAEHLADRLDVRSENGRTIVTAVRSAVLG
jgi:anti-sigma regulatory factor (Ser/Thr protein kinase)